MKHAPLFLLTLGLAGLASSPARADELTIAPVHVEGTLSSLVLEGTDDHGYRETCRAPCEKRLDLRMRYRVVGEGIEPSRYFKVSPTITTIATTPGSKHTGLGIVFSALSVAFLGGGITLLGAAQAGSHGDLGIGAAFAAMAGIPLVASGVAFGIPGVYFLAASTPSEVRTLPGPRAARSFPMPSVAVAF